MDVINPRCTERARICLVSLLPSFFCNAVRIRNDNVPAPYTACEGSCVSVNESNSAVLLCRVFLLLDLNLFLLADFCLLRQTEATRRRYRIVRLSRPKEITFLKNVFTKDILPKWVA